MSDDEGGAHEDPEYNPEDALPQEPSGERVVTTMGVTFTLRAEDHHKTMEEEEDSQFTVRAKLYRFEHSDNEWKEKGTGEVKIMKHKGNGKVRVLMRRDKTLKICANHLIATDMNLRPHVGSDKAWVWHVTADYSDGAATPDLLAIRFANAENAQKFKAAFDDGRAQNDKVLATLRAAAPAASATPSPPATPAPAEKKDV